MSALKRIINHSTDGIVTGALVLAAAALASRMLGFLRNALLASTFGAGPVLDAYFLAFRLPDLIFNVLFFGALSAGFVPVFIKLKKQNEGEAWTLANDIFNLALIAFTGFGLLFFIFAPFVVRLLAPGFDEETLALGVTMSRIMFLQPIFLGVSGIFSGVLQSVRKFLSYALSPIFYNIGIIVGIVVFVPFLGPIGLAWGVVLGAALHLFSQYPAARESGWRWKPVFRPGMFALKRVLSIMIPRSLSLIVHQITLVILVSMATVISAGAVSVFNFANDLYGAALGILVVPMSVAAFPAFVRASEDGGKGFAEQVYWVLRKLLFFLAPLAAIAIIVRAQIVRLALGYGNFGWDDTILTIDTFAYLMVGLLFHGALLLVLRAYFAEENAKTPLIVLSLGMVITVVAALYLRSSMGIAGLALALTIGNLFSAGILFTLLMVRLGKKYIALTFRSAGIFVAGAVLAGFAARGVLYLAAGLLVPTEKVWGLLVQGSLAVCTGAGVYLLFMLLFRQPEAVMAWARVRAWRLPKEIVIEEAPEEELPR